MSALDQYLDLFCNHRNLVDSNSVTPLNRLREDALKVLREKGLPRKGSENYEVTDLNELLAPDFGLNLARINIDANPAASFHCGVPSLSVSPLFQINDIIESSSGVQNKEGIWIGSIQDFYARYPEVLASHYGRIADIENPLVALNTLFAQDGIVVWVKEGYKIESPIQIVNILHNGAPLMSVRRLLIIMENNSEVKILSCDHSQSNAISFLNLQTIEIFVGKHASLDFYDLEESSEKTCRLSSLFLNQDEESHVTLENITLYNGVTRNEVFTKFIGENARLRLQGLGIEDKTRQLDTFTNIEHDAAKCVSDELFKYVVDENAIGSFTGLIKVVKGADKTEAYQSNRNIVGSDTARMFSKPQLEIYDDDVKCSHGCAIGQLDETQIFYMQTRGIPENEAKFLLKQAFMADVLEGIGIQTLKDRLKVLVEKRFSGQQLNCSVCGADCKTQNKCESL